MTQTVTDIRARMTRLVEDMEMPAGQQTLKLFVVGFVEDGETYYRANEIDDTLDITHAYFFKSREEAQDEINEEIERFSDGDEDMNMTPTDGSEYFIKEVTLSY